MCAYSPDQRRSLHAGHHQYPISNESNPGNIFGLCGLIGTLSIDNEIHDDDFRNPRRIGSRVSFSAGKTKVKQRVV